MSILIARHGETVSNATRIVQMPDAALSERGRLQADRLAARLATLGVAAIVASDYLRAVETAERVRLSTGAPLELWPELRERNFGALRGRSHDSFDFDVYAVGYDPPDGEGWDSFQARMIVVWARIRERAAVTAGNLAVITHGLVLHGLAEHFVTVSVEDLPVQWPNASLTIVSSQPPYAPELLGSIEHLSGI